ncbi:type IV conjugative transfer system protein TraL [Pseudomonas putida]|uniref:hypothetical protein n=1 Tax=Pseudomonas putida TaxID=303 RepID=UPI0023643D3C|nr:hypothetical protein [Pseudomonas putida]MDD2139889.1 type IV conjugative transfer system protein TraL [Pseudomonas putida]HDS1721812.1 hypothetical protein [Pseudomonas putida]
MDLRVTTETDTYVYATSTMRIGGLDPEDFILFLLPVATLNTAGFQPVVSLFVGIFCLWLYKSLTKDQPPGFLPVLLSVKAGDWYNSRLVQNVPVLRKLVHWLVKIINQVWISHGLLPLPSYCNYYER